MKTILNHILLLSLLISMGCGFHLRGAYQFPEHLQSMVLLPKDNFSPFHRSLKRALKKQKIHLIASEQNHNSMILQLTQPNFTDVILAYNTHGQPERFKLSLTVGYQLIQTNQELCYQGEITRSREMTVNPKNPANSNKERQLHHKDLIEDVVHQLLTQLSKKTCSINSN